MGDEKGDQSMFHSALKSLCCSYRWSYGVFWRFNPPNSLLLTMEEAYCEVQMGTIVDNMLLQVHMIGNGMVGQVAFTKRQRWMFSDDHFGRWDVVPSVENQISLEDDSDIHTQFLYGIQTIALIYVESLGVIQFGSTLKIPETSEFVDHTKKLFQEAKELETFILAEIMPLTSDIDGISSGISSFPGNQNSTLGSLENYMGAPCFSTNLPPLSPFTADNGTMDSYHLVNQLQMAIEDASFKSSNESLQEPLLNPTNYVNDSAASFPCTTMSSSTIPDALHAPFQERNFTTPQLETFPLEVSSLSASLHHPSDSVQSSIIDEFQFDDYENCLNELFAETDLFDDLGIDFDFGEDVSFLDDIVSPVVGGDHLGFSSCTSEYTSEQHNWMHNLGLDHFLDGIAGSSHSIMSSSFGDELYLAKRRQIESTCSVIRDSREHTHVLDRKKVMGSVVGSSYKITRWSSDVPLSKSSQNFFKSASSKKKKGKAGTRLKSPDRVVIDACISELRKLIPSGSKMSIVSLLAQTAKHVVFLQSMTKHAEKLKQAGGSKEHEVILKDCLCNSGDSAMWECDIGDARVKDLSCPGHKLIQVIMEESGCFFEMVDVVQGLGLTILKGVMEVKEKKIRTYFLVEAEGNILVSNEQIYMSLRQFLQQKATASEVITSDRFGEVLVGGTVMYNNLQQPFVRHHHHLC